MEILKRIRIALHIALVLLSLFTIGYVLFRHKQKDDAA